MLIKLSENGVAFGEQLSLLAMDGVKLPAEQLEASYAGRRIAVHVQILRADNVVVRRSANVTIAAGSIRSLGRNPSGL
ncbi:MAG: hypothetical protein JWO88_213 [Frankiales bacterium]|nr:hypothetical protein [Frankiales bacterium]